MITTTIHNTQRDLLKEPKAMNAAGILVTFAGVLVGASVIIAVLFRYWPRYGSVEAAVASTDQVLDQMEHGASEH